MLCFVLRVSFLLGATVDYRRGAFIRSTGSRAPLHTVVTDFNPALFALFNVSTANSTWGPGGFIWPEYHAEKRDFSSIAFKYFSPDRLEDVSSDARVIVATNLALTPQLRIASMVFWNSA